MDERRVLSDQSDHSRKRGRIKTAAGREGKGGWVGAEREKEREREESSIVEMMGRDSQQAHRTHHHLLPLARTLPLALYRARVQFPLP